MRSSLVKQKILPPIAGDVKKVSQTKITNIKLDEFVAKNREEVRKSAKNKIPVFPKLRLTRMKPKKEQIRVPVAVTILRFPCDNDFY